MNAFYLKKYLNDFNVGQKSVNLFRDNVNIVFFYFSVLPRDALYASSVQI